MNLSRLTIVREEIVIPESRIVASFFVGSASGVLIQIGVGHKFSNGILSGREECGEKQPRWRSLLEFRHAE